MSLLQSIKNSREIGFSLIKDKVSTAIAEKEREAIKAEIKAETAIATRAQVGRASWIDPTDRLNYSNPIIESVGNERIALKEVSYKNIIGRALKEILKALVKSSPDFSACVRIFRDHVVQDYHLESEDDDAIAIIEDFIVRFGGKTAMMNLLRQLAYGIYVEGGVACELVQDLQQVPQRIVYISPFTLAFQKRENEDIGEYYVVGQKDITNKLIEPVLIDPSTDDDEYTKYVPTNQIGDDPRGYSMLAPAIMSSTIGTSMIRTLLEYIQGKVFPQRIYYVDTDSLANAGYQPEQIDEVAQEITESINEMVNGSDITQEYVIPAKIGSLVVSALERSNLDGLDIIMNSADRSTRRVAGLPRALFTGHRDGGALNDNSDRVEWYAWEKTKESARVAIEEPITELFELILLNAGSVSDVKLKLDRKDPELNRLESEQFKMRMEGWAINKGIGALTLGEIRLKMIQDSIDLSKDIDPELPPELQSQEAERQQGSNAENDGEQSQDGVDT